ncbi:MAG: SDR family NAD(P)-dependent oxidoreductase [Pseudomonadota bacterium]
MTQLAAYEGKLALVTGAGDGIGAMLARKLAAAGMKVCVQDIRVEAAEAVAEDIGASAFAIGGDVSDMDSLADAAAAVRARGEPLNLLWLNAGVGVGAPVLSGKPSAIDWGFGVNVLGVIWSAQAFAPLMENAAGPKHVGFTASTAALRPPEGDFPLYATTKHCTFAVAEALSGEFKREGIDTTILCPGLLNTDIWDGARARPERFGGVRRMDPKISGHWRAAQDPDVMWPHIAGKIDAGGGYLVCATDTETKAIFETRAQAIADSFVDLSPKAP